MGVLLAAVFCMLLCHCGKKEETEQTGSICRDYDHAGYTAEGMVYQDYDAGLVKYLDYGTEAFYPLCVKPNCLHNSDECVAKALCGEIRFMGRLEDKWYYYQEGETEAAFHSCDLDGENDRVIGTYPYEESKEDGIWNLGRGDVWGNIVFQDGSCFLAMGIDNLEEDPNNPGSFSGGSSTCNLYRYDLETGEREALCPEKTMEIPCYVLWGIYKNQLIYSELLDEESRKRVSGIRKLDLETKEISDLGLTAREVLGAGCLSEHLLLYNEPDIGLMEYDLETGEKRKISKDYGSNVVWEPELKTFTTVDSSEEEYVYRVYQYMEEGECHLLYEGDVFIPSALAGDLVIGHSAAAPRFMYEKSFIKKEDFLAGKTNWTVIVETE